MRLWIASALVLCACTARAPQEEVPSWGAIPNDHARFFQLQVRGAERRLLVFGPGGDMDTAGVYPLDASGKEKRIALASTTHIPYLSALKAMDQVVGLAHVDRVRDPFVEEAVKAGRITELERAGTLDREVLVALHPDLLFDYPFGKHFSDRYSWGVAVTEYLEEHPLGRAEWLRFFGLMLDREEEADSLYEAIAHRYTVARDMAKHLEHAPVVLFGSQWEHRWWMPHGQSYMATLINDAGGRYWSNDTSAMGNIAVSLEELIALGGTCDHLGIILEAAGPVDAMELAGGDARVAGLKAVSEGGFVGNSARSDLFGQALLEPEVILKDLRCIFHPGSCAGHVPRYFFPLGQ